MRATGYRRRGYRSLGSRTTDGASHLPARGDLSSVRGFGFDASASLSGGTHGLPVSDGNGANRSAAPSRQRIPRHAPPLPAKPGNSLNMTAICLFSGHPPGLTFQPFSPETLRLPIPSATGTFTQLRS